jgi:hypothetical protein
MTAKKANLECEYQPVSWIQDLDTMMCYIRERHIATWIHSQHRLRDILAARMTAICFFFFWLGVRDEGVL